MNEKDYVVIGEKDKKPALIQVSTFDDKTITGVLEKDRRTSHKVVEVLRKDVMTNLGRNPKPGKVYGIDVSNLYRSTINHEWWGPIHFYVRPDSATLKILRTSLDRTASILDKAGFEPFLEKFETEIRAKTGKWAGMYEHNPKKKSLVWYAPDWAQGSATTMNYIILHEFGHVVRFNGMQNAVKLRQKWLRLFQQSIKPIVIPSKATKLIWSKLEQARKEDDEVGFNEALKGIAGEDEKYAKAVKVLTYWFKHVQHLGTKDLSLAWQANDLEYLKDVWPKSDIDSSDIAPVISEYATKNVEELFAECFAMYMGKTKLPAAYNELMEKSIIWAKKSLG